MTLLPLRPAAQKRIATVALALGCLTPATTAFAQSSEERMGARAAASEGARAFSEKRWGDAIDYFKRAESLVHAPPHLLYIARAQAQTGQFVEARENYLAIIHEELKPGAPEVFKAAKESASKEIHDVEAHFAYAAVTVKGDVPKDAIFQQDGVRVPTALIGISRPVNPGTHKFEVSGSGAAGSASLTIKEGERQKVVIELSASSAPPLAPTPAPVTTPEPAAAAAATPTAAPASTSGPPEADQGTSAPAAEPGKKSTALLIGSFVGFGVGVAGVAVGTAFTLSASSKQSDADKLFNGSDCANTGCPDQRPRIDDLDSQAKSARGVGIGGFIAGGVGIAAGATLLVLYLRSGSSATTGKSQPSLMIAGGPSSVLVRGSF